MSASLGIQVPPVFSIRPVDKVAKLGESVVLQCRVDHMQMHCVAVWQVSHTSEAGRE